MKTPRAPADAASAPDPAGTINCPNRLPINLADTAKARSFAAVFCETNDIVKGCPMPSEKPATKTIAPSESGVFANAIPAQASTETEVLTINN